MSDSDCDSQDECTPQRRPFVMAERSRPDLRMFWRPPLAYAQEGCGACLVLIREQVGLRAYNALAQADRWWGLCQKWIKLHDKAIVEGRPGLIGRWIPRRPKRQSSTPTDHGQSEPKHFRCCFRRR